MTDDEFAADGVDGEATFVVEDVDRVDFVKYAGASGDFNPVHVDETYARQAGYPSVFGHGMLVAGYASQLLSNWFGTHRVRRLRTRFESRLWPGDTATLRGEIVERRTDDGVAVADVSITGTNQDDDVILTGDGTVTLPEP